MAKPGLPHDRAGRTALRYAAMGGDEEKVRELLQHYAPSDRDLEGFTPLHLAAQESHAGVAAVLTAAGADVDAQDR